MTEKRPLLLVTLTPSQIALAKDANGARRKITHALVCGDLGQDFGTEKQCRDRYDTWKLDSMDLFSEARECNAYDFSHFVGNRALVLELVDASSSGKRIDFDKLLAGPGQSEEGSGSWWTKLFGRR